VAEALDHTPDGSHIPYTDGFTVRVMRATDGSADMAADVPKQSAGIRGGPGVSRFVVTQFVTQLVARVASISLTGSSSSRLGGRIESPGWIDAGERGDCVWRGPALTRRCS
jgi:hypothetical protein